jgi:ATP-dependent Clp protease ATP-binding subunit ClpC
MFEKFTDGARRVVVLAQEEARMLLHDYIGTEHILLGLLHEGDGVAAKTLESLGVSLQPARDQVLKLVGRGKRPPSGHIPFTPRAKKVMELSLREALQLGDNFIGTQHILLGLLREGEGVAVQALVAMGIDLNRVRQQVVQLAGQESPPEDFRATRSAETAEPVVVQQVRVPMHAWMTSVQESLDKIMDRLSAIERHLGVPGSPAQPDQPGGAPGKPEKPDLSEGGEIISSGE